MTHCNQFQLESLEPRVFLSGDGVVQTALAAELPFENADRCVAIEEPQTAGLLGELSPALAYDPAPETQDLFQDQPQPANDPGNAGDFDRSIAAEANLDPAKLVEPELPRATTGSEVPLATVSFESGSVMAAQSIQTLRAANGPPVSLQAIGSVPASIDPNAATQVMFPTGSSDWEFQANPGGPASQLLKFSFDGTGFSGSVQFNLDTILPDAPADGALALYDRDGNQLALADTDSAAGHPGQESLTATIESRRVYVLGLFFNPPGPASGFRLTAKVDPQLANPTITVNPTSGLAVFDGNSGEDTFNSTSDVDYYPFDLLNAGAGGTVKVSPTGLDGAVAATLFRRLNSGLSWQPIAQGLDASGAPLELTLTPPPDRSLTDAQYLLAVAPANFTAPARSYQISVATTLPQLGPATVNVASGVADLFTPAPVTLGLAQVTHTGMLSLPEMLFRFGAPADGVATLSLATNQFDPLISVFDASGSNLLQVASKTSPGTNTLLLPVTAGTEYVVRAGDVGSNTGGNFALTISAPYTPTDLVLGQTVTQVGPLAVGPSQGAKFFRLQPDFNSDVLALEVAPGTGASPMAARVVILGANLPAIERQAAAGATLFLPVNISGRIGPYDLYIGGTAGTDPATVQIGQIALPDELNLDQLNSAKLDLQGDLTATLNAGAFGAVSGVEYFQLLTQPGQAATLSVAGTNAWPLLASYQEKSGKLRRVDFALPDNAAKAVLSHQPSAQLYGVAAFSLGFSGGGSIQFDVTGPDLLGAGVAMVPDLEFEEKNPGKYQFLLKIEEITLAQEFEQHLWRTLLPFNLAAGAVPKVTFTPGTIGGSLQTRISVYDGNGALLASQTNSPGQELTFPVPAAGALPGQPLVFRIEPQPGQLGDGNYTLIMTVTTDDPHPFEVTQTAWQFAGTNPTIDVADSAKPGTFPVGEKVVDIVQNQFGDGSAIGEFTSSSPYSRGLFGNTSSIDVYRFWAINPGPVIVRTVPLDATVNTNLKVYRPHFKNGVVDYLGKIDGVATSLDWYQADRSQIDAQSFINDFDLLSSGPFSSGAEPYGTGGGMYFVVVMNEQGTQGKYRIEVDAPSFPNLGGIDSVNDPIVGYRTTISLDRHYALSNQVAYIPPTTGGSVNLHLPYVESFVNFLGYFPVQLPDYHDGTLKIQSQPNATWEYTVFDSNGKALPGSFSNQDSPTVIGTFTVGTYTIPSGPQTLYLRVFEIVQNGKAWSTLTLSANLVGFRVGTVTAPPPTLPSMLSPPRMLPTNALADGSISDSMAFNGAVKAYMFRAATGQLTVHVEPETPTDVRLQWGVYADQKLVAWDYTRADASGFVEGTTTTTVALPKLRQPGASPDYAYDLAPYHDIVIYVQAVSAPQSGGNFAVSVNSSATRPLRSAEVVIHPLTGTVNFATSGLAWLHLVVPDDISPPVRIEKLPTGIPIHYDLYDFSGAKLLSSATVTLGLRGGSPFLFLPEATAGSSYYFRIGLEGNPLQNLNLTAFPAALFKAATFSIHAKPPLADQQLFPELVYRADPPPDGKFFLGFDNRTTNEIAAVAFWVNTPGIARFSAALGDAPNPYVALYHGYLGGGEFPVQWLRLVDYTNNANVVGSINYPLDAYVEPGLYVLKIVRSGGGSKGIALINFDLPDYVPEEIVLDPNSGSSMMANLQATENAQDEGDILSSFRTRFYHVVTPAASTGVMTANAVNLTSGKPGDLRAFLTVWRRPDPAKPYIQYTSLDRVIEKTKDAMGTVTPPGKAIPFDDYWISLNRQALNGKIAVSATFMVPQSGTPDLVVEPLVLSPNNGETRVDVTVRNLGYASAFTNHARFQYPSAIANQPVISDMLEHTIGPFGTKSRVLAWVDPVAPSDRVSYRTDIDNQIVELDEKNNFQDKPLSSVDAHRPVVALALGDPLIDGNSAPGVWGRYISGVPGARADIHLTMTDADNAANTYGDGQTDLYRGIGRLPYYDVAHPQGQPIGIGPDSAIFKGYDFGRLLPTTPNNPNIIRLYAIDRFGLKSDEVIRIIQVVKPGWPTSITYDPVNRQYKIGFNNALINYHKTVSQILGFSVPIVGDKDNQFVVEINAATTATLDPTKPVSASVTAHAFIKVVDTVFFEKTYGGDTPVTDHFSIKSYLAIDPATLDTTAFAVSFQLKNLDLFHFQGPKITLFSYGLSGVASIDAYIKFGLSGALDAAVTLGLDPSIIQNPLSPPVPLGLLPPTFVKPSVTASATVGGALEVLGFDLASLEGTVSLTLNVAFGLDSNDPSKVVRFVDFLKKSCVEVSVDIGIGIEAEVIGITVWDFEPDPIHIPLGDTCNHGGIIKLSETGNDRFGQVLLAIAGVRPIDLAALMGNQNPTIKNGSALVGPVVSDPRPNIVIDPVGGGALYLQLVDSNPSPEVTLNNLAFSRRDGGVWSPLTTLSQSANIANPVLSLTHDRPGLPAVAVYQAANVSGNPSTLTVNQFLAAQDIRWRYYDGSSWQNEQSLTSDDRYDFAPAVSFNPTGQGVMAWVHNKNATPLSNTGQFDRSANEIHVAAWNPQTHSWSAAQTLTSNSVSDSNPSVFADPSGKLYALWLQDTPDGNQIMFSMSDGTFWSAAAPLPIIGLPPGSKVKELAIGTEAPGRIDVLLSNAHLLADGSLQSRIYNRPSTTAAFTAPTALETVASDAGFSHLRALQHPDGGIVAYWQQSDGITNEIFGSRIVTTGPGHSSWSQPTQFSSGSELEFAPSVAVETDGSYQVVYELKTPPGNALGPALLSAAVAGLPAGVGVGATHVKPLPELAFSREVFFPYRDLAASGSQTTAEAQIINRGLKSTGVVIESFLGQPGTGTLLNSRTITLGPGRTYDLTQAFTVKAGSNTYAFRIKTADGGPELVGAQDNASSATLTGMPDLAVFNVALSTSAPLEGQTVQVTGEIRNLSDQAVGPFAVAVYQGDPAFRQLPAVPLGTVQLAGLAPFAQTNIQVPWTVPIGGGDFTLTVVADSTKAIAEATEFNNDGQAFLSIRPDAALVSTAPLPAVQATALNDTGINNAKIDASIHNLGQATLVNLEVELFKSLDDGSLQPAGSTVIPTLAANDSAAVSFTTSALAGVNRYRVVLDPDNQLADANRGNNVAETLLVLQGLADLTVGQVTLEPALPAQGEPLSLMAQISNQGIASARDILIEVFAGSGQPDNPGLLVGQITLGVLEPLSNASIKIPVTTDRLAGAQTLYVIVDRHESILEKSHLNNTGSISATFLGTPLKITATSVNGGLIQRSRVRSVALTFGADVGASLIAGDLIFTNHTTGNNIDASKTALDYDPKSRVATWTFPGLAGLTLPAGNYRLTLPVSSVADGAGNQLAQDFTLNFFVLRGDANGDRITNEFDLYRVWQNLLKPAAARDLNEDLNGDHQVDLSDLKVVQDNYLRQLPAP